MINDNYEKEIDELIIEINKYDVTQKEIAQCGRDIEKLKKLKKRMEDNVYVHQQNKKKRNLKKNR